MLAVNSLSQAARSISLLSTGCDNNQHPCADQETSVTSAITDPPPDSMLPASTKTVAVRGYAYSGGGRGIVRVEVTADDGGSWTMARTRSDPQKQSRCGAVEQANPSVIPRNGV